jgi:hypothetical protein
MARYRSAPKRLEINDRDELTADEETKTDPAAARRRAKEERAATRRWAEEQLAAARRRAAISDQLEGVSGHSYMGRDGERRYVRGGGKVTSFG